MKQKNMTVSISWGDCFIQVGEDGGGAHRELFTIVSAGCHWLIPIILAIQEAEIRRIMV
jgi:hypothetical protein